MKWCRMKMFIVLIVSFAPLLSCGAAVGGGESTLKRRRLTRFTVGHDDNKICWDRHGADGFFTVIDAHNHFRPFGGPNVPFDTYVAWMRQHGILFSTVFGIGQRIMKKKPNDPDCCYYLHCPTLDYPVVPDPTNDLLNAIDYNNYLRNEALVNSIHLTVSATYANLQRPANNTQTLDMLQKDFPDVFKWAGELNIFKHALAGNGFFAQPRVTVGQIESGMHDAFFARLSKQGWPVTIHCDMGCDNYDDIPKTPETERGCEVPSAKVREAWQNHRFWMDLLGVHYPAFFDEVTNQPNPVNFKKIQHMHVFDAFLSRFPDLRVVWSHVGLSKELRDLHPLVHAHLLTTLFDRHANLHADLSWDVLPKIVLMNFANKSIARILHQNHVDFDEDAAHLFNHGLVAALRRQLHRDVWEGDNRASVHLTGSRTLGGPTYAMAIYLHVFNKYSRRFVTGTDFVASFGSAHDYPGVQRFKDPPTGCVKGQTDHARQLTDTSAVNMFLDDTAFRRIVLGENYFRLLNMQHKFAPPPICGHEEGGLGGGAVVGIIIGMLLFMLIVSAIVGFLVYRSKEAG